jgi:hypothetical protein
VHRLVLLFFIFSWLSQSHLDTHKAMHAVKALTRPPVQFARPVVGLLRGATPDAYAPTLEWTPRLADAVQTPGVLFAAAKEDALACGESVQTHVHRITMNAECWLSKHDAHGRADLKARLQRHAPFSSHITVLCGGISTGKSTLLKKLVPPKRGWQWQSRPDALMPVRVNGRGTLNLDIALREELDARGCISAASNPDSTTVALLRALASHAEERNLRPVLFVDEASRVLDTYGGALHKVTTNMPLPLLDTMSALLELAKVERRMGVVLVTSDAGYPAALADAMGLTMARNLRVVHAGEVEPFDMLELMTTKGATGPQEKVPTWGCHMVLPNVSGWGVGDSVAHLLVDVLGGDIRLIVMALHKLATEGENFRLQTVLPPTDTHCALYFGNRGIAVRDVQAVQRRLAVDGVTVLPDSGHPIARWLGRENMGLVLGPGRKKQGVAVVPVTQSVRVALLSGLHYAGSN